MDMGIVRSKYSVVLAMPHSLRVRPRMRKMMDLLGNDYVNFT
jgi:hypothetical protein